MLRQHFVKKGTLHLKKSNKTYDITFVNHHFSHAWYAAAASGFKPVLIMTADGGLGPTFQGGGFYFYDKQVGVVPICSGNLILGPFYDVVSVFLGLGHVGEAGKLMGLAPYGRPVFFSSRLIGTATEVLKRYGVRRMKALVSRWLGAIPRSELMWNPRDRYPPLMVANIAASAQLVLEQNLMCYIDILKTIALKNKVPFEKIIGAGGTFLNCPSNSLLKHMHPEFEVCSAVNDEGLSIGCAFRAGHDLEMGIEENKSNYSSYFPSPYLGHEITEEEIKKCNLSSIGVVKTKIKSTTVDTCCQLLLNGEILGIAENRSECGPRALGHRSLIAGAWIAESWDRLNKMKGREPWRPFAPVVLEEDFHEFFYGPLDSPFMLYTHQVRSKCLPAITHFDHSARVQEI